MARIRTVTATATAKVAKAVKFFREEKHWSRSMLASKSGLTVSYISMLERGQRTGELRDNTLWKLADALGVTASDLVEFTGDRRQAKSGRVSEKGPAYGSGTREARLFKLLNQLSDEQLEALELFVDRLLAKGIGRE